MTWVAILFGSTLIFVGLWGISRDLGRIGNALCGTAWQETTWGETPLIRIAESLEQLRHGLAPTAEETQKAHEDSYYADFDPTGPVSSLLDIAAATSHVAEAASHIQEAICAVQETTKPKDPADALDLDRGRAVLMVRMEEAG